MRINNTSEDVASYDTHLIIALNEEAYTLLVNFNMNDVAIPKHAFKNGTPTPYAGQIVNITVAVRKNGNLTESFNVTTYYDNTPICTLSVTGPHLQEQTNLLFAWNTTNVQYCNKTIKAEAEAVPDELDTSNNFYVIENAVKVKIPGDVNGDGRVDIYDIILIASIYACKEDDPCWNPQADLAEPYGIINIYDVITAASHYGEKC